MNLPDDKLIHAAARQAFREQKGDPPFLMVVGFNPDTGGYRTAVLKDVPFTAFQAGGQMSPFHLAADLRLYCQSIVASVRKGLDEYIFVAVGIALPGAGVPGKAEIPADVARMDQVTAAWKAGESIRHLTEPTTALALVGLDGEPMYAVKHPQGVQVMQEDEVEGMAPVIKCLDMLRTRFVKAEMDAKPKIVMGRTVATDETIPGDCMMRCEQCTVDLWIGPLQQKMIANNPDITTVLCPQCGAVAAQAAGVQYAIRLD